MTVVQRETAQHYVWGGSCDGWILLPRSDLNVIQERMPPNTSETPHHHDVSRQFFYVLSGVLTMILEGKRHDVPQHAGIEVPPGALHQACNLSDADTEFLVISHPTTREDRVDQRSTSR